MSVNFNKGAFRAIPIGSESNSGLPVFPFGVRMLPLITELPDTGLHVAGLGGITKVPHEVIAWLYGKTFTLTLSATGAGSSKGFTEAFALGQSKSVAFGETVETGDALDSIHSAFAASSEVGTAASINYTEIGFSSSCSISGFPAKGASRVTYYPQLDAWSLPIALTGLLNVFDDEDLLTNQFLFNSGAILDGIVDDITFCGVPIKIGAESGLILSGSITVDSYLPTYPPL